MKLLLLLSLLAVSLSYIEGTVVCYYSSWAVYRPGKGIFEVEDIDASLCTHLIYAFAGLKTNGHIMVFDPYNDLCEDYGMCGYNRFTGLKKTHPNIKTTLGVGGWNEGSTKYSNMAADPAKRQTFISSTLTLLKKHNFDGLDMDWEYPTQRGGSPDDYVNYVTLLTELKEALHAEGMILTAAVSAGKPTIDAAYNVPAVSEQLDLINLMTYDLHGDWEPYTHHQSCLYPHPDDTGDTLTLNVDFAVTYWLEKGAPKDKLVMGIPLYGRTWTLDDPDQHDFYAPASRPGIRGPYTEEPGYLGYNEICESQTTSPGDWTIVHDPAMNEPYAYNLKESNLWTSYEDADSAGIKAQYALDKGIAGCMVWSIDTDDYRGICQGTTYPILTMINEVLSGGIYTKPTRPPTTTRDPSVTTPAPGEHCSVPGPNADDNDCTHYYLCTQLSEGWDEFEEKCSGGTLFNPVAKFCDWKDSVCALEPAVCPNDCA
ncbi:chitinase-3-like protein 1 [Macrobrachium rosenbergii]|uniref:chitinase-3-like protein 1 n=1 Tax=Macrobrachium rosenbergii TaxID=79674 RepID=UPI0034D7624D